MGNKDDDLAAKIEEIRQMFLQRVRDEWLPKLGALRGGLALDWKHSSLTDVVFLSHTMAGSGATFGYHGISEVARRIEIATRAMVSDETTATSASRDNVLSDLERLEQESVKALKDLRAPS